MKTNLLLLLSGLVAASANADDLLPQSPHDWQITPRGCYEKVQENQLRPGESLEVANARVKEQIMGEAFVLFWVPARAQPSRRRKVCSTSADSSRAPRSVRREKKTMFDLRKFGFALLVFLAVSFAFGSTT
jgi:hypothetical protein